MGRRKKKEQKTKETANDWKYNWMDGQDKSGNQYEGNEDNRNIDINGEDSNVTAP